MHARPAYVRQERGRIAWLDDEHRHLIMPLTLWAAVEELAALGRPED